MCLDLENSRKRCDTTEEMEQKVLTRQEPLKSAELTSEASSEGLAQFNSLKFAQIEDEMKVIYFESFSGLWLCTCLLTIIYIVHLGQKV
jgi:hypothetical protein